MPTQDIYVNSNSASLSNARVLSSTNDQSVGFKNFVVGDQDDFDIYIVDGAGAYVDISGYATVRCGVGGINKRPTGGTFTLEGGLGQQTIPFDSNAATMDTLITAAQAACSVETPVAGVWIVTFDANGAQSLPTTDSELLEPDCSVSVKTLVTGDGSTKAVWIIRLFQTPWAYSESWSNITNGVRGSLNFGTANLYEQMAAADSLSGYFELELTDAGGNVTTVIQAPVVIVGEVIGDGVAGSGTFASYITRNYETVILAVTDETESATTGTDKITFRAPYAITLTSVRASAATAPTGSVLTIDINEAGSTILSTKLTIDAGEKTSTTAATAPVISDSALADDAEIGIDIDTIGSGTAGAGIKVYLIGYRA